MQEYSIWIREISDAVRQMLDMTAEVSDSRVYRCIDQVILNYTRNAHMNVRQKTELREKVFNSLRRLDVLQELLDDEDITEIMINGYDNIFVEKKGVLKKTEKSFESPERYEDIVQQIVSRAGRMVNRQNPIVDARLEDGSRVNVILEPISLDGTSMTIRKFADRSWNLDKLVEFGTLDDHLIGFLRILVQSKYNIIVSGGTGSGKTTFLNLLSDFIPEEERVVTIEDSAELNMKRILNLVRLETRNANVEGEHGIEMKDLIRASLRQRPDRLLIGEVRGEEAFFMINGAMNTGHDGSLSTCHSNSCMDTISRLETMMLMECEIPMAALRRQIGSAVDIIVHLGRLRDRSRKVLEICEVSGTHDGEVRLSPLFLFEEEREEEGKIIGRWRMVSALSDRTKLRLAGMEDELIDLEELIRSESDS